MTKWIFPKSCIFWKMCLDSKQDIKENHEIYSVLHKHVWGSARKKSWEMSDIEAECFVFLNCCKLTLSQIEIIIKFLKIFVKEDLKFGQMALCEGFSYCKCEMLWLLSCIA